ncbi:MAG: ABC transporter permease [Anaerolineae bacterium]|nr:ABC transporter permease [Anaerolineae bacterium]
MRAQRYLSFGFAYYLLLALFLYLPILVLVIFSFNDSTLLVYPLKGFTLRWYSALLNAHELLDAVRNSVIVGFASSFVSVVFGAMAALAIARFNFPGRGFFLAISSLPLVIPYVVLSVALVLLFAQIGVPLSLFAVGVAHTVINIPYVMLIVAARLAGFEQNLEEAAMDLGATYWGTLMRVTLPIAAPALAAAFLSSFTTSFDEFALAFFLTGTENTLPVYLYSQLRFPNRLPLVVALAAIIMLVSVLLIIFSEWLRRIGTQTTPRGAE